jgi:hypothetical protein
MVGLPATGKTLISQKGTSSMAGLLGCEGVIRLFHMFSLEVLQQGVIDRYNEERGESFYDSIIYMHNFSLPMQLIQD